MLIICNFFPCLNFTYDTKNRNQVTTTILSPRAGKRGDKSDESLRKIKPLFDEL